MSESNFVTAADRVMDRIEDVLGDLDPSRIDVERPAAGVLTMSFAGAGKCVLNTQKPMAQLWLAYGATAWHFSQDAKSGQWHDVRRPELELYAVITEVVRGASGVAVRWA